MIREISPNVGSGGSDLNGGERVLTMYRMWTCFDCGLEFSMKTREQPKLCPRCETPFLEPIR